MFNRSNKINVILCLFIIYSFISFLANYQNVYAISASTLNPQRIGYIAGNTTIRVPNIAVGSNNKAVAASIDGTNIIDISNPANPSIIYSYTEHKCNSVTIVSNYAYLLCEWGIVSINLNDATPVPVYTPGGTGYEITNFNGKLYVTSIYKKFEEYNLSNPSVPHMTREMPLETYCNQMAITANGIALLGSVQNDSVYAIDLKLSSLTLKSTFHVSGANFISDITTSGNRTYISGNNDLNALDINSDGTYIERAHLGKRCQIMVAYQNFVSCGLYNIEIIDFTNPSNPITYYVNENHMGQIGNMILTDTHLFVGDEGILDIFILSSPTRLRITKTSSPSTIRADEQITHSIKIENTTSSTMTNIRLTDILKQQNFISASNGGTYDSANWRVTWNIGTLSPGATTTVSYIGQPCHNCNN